MQIKTPVELGAVIRRRRRELRLSQQALADKAMVGRQWLIGVERGKASAEVDLVLRTLAALGLVLRAQAAEAPSPAPEIDAVIAAARKNAP